MKSVEDEPTTDGSGIAEMGTTSTSRGTTKVPLPTPGTPMIKESLYLNEATGHVLNMSNHNDGVCGIYHKLLQKSSTAFQSQFRGRNPCSVGYDNDEIRFIWDNIISVLQRVGFVNIVLCPDSEKAVDVDPKLLLLEPNDQTKLHNNRITFRTIGCIRSALYDRDYIVSSTNRENHTNTNFSANPVDASEDSAERRIMVQESRNLDTSHYTRNELEMKPTDATKETKWGCTNARKKIEIIDLVGNRTDVIHTSKKNGHTGDIVQAFTTDATQRHSGSTDYRSFSAGTKINGEMLKSVPEAAVNTLDLSSVDKCVKGGFSASEKETVIAQETICQEREQKRCTRSSFSSDLLPDQKKQKLSEREMDGERKKNWETRYRELLEHFFQHGNFSVKLGVNKGLVSFIKKVRYNHGRKLKGHKHSLSDEREFRLHSIGFPWVVKKSGSGMIISKPEAEYRALKEYGRTHVTEIVDLDSDRCRWFKRWARERLQFIAEAQKPQYELQMMRELGFQWTSSSVPTEKLTVGRNISNPMVTGRKPAPPVTPVLENDPKNESYQGYSWLVCYRALVCYHTQYGTMDDVPHGTFLHEFIRRMCIAYALYKNDIDNELMIGNRKALLDALPFDWDDLAERFESTTREHDRGVRAAEKQQRQEKQQEKRQEKQQVRRREPVQSDDRMTPIQVGEDDDGYSDSDSDDSDLVF